jgi:hypothetical protein
MSAASGSPAGDLALPPLDVRSVKGAADSHGRFSGGGDHRDGGVGDKHERKDVPDGLEAAANVTLGRWLDEYLREQQRADGLLGERGLETVPPDSEAADQRSGAATNPDAGQETWPEDLPDIAYCGLIGDIAKAIAPETESDPAAILLQVAVAMGSLIGRGPHVRVEGDEHHPNLFALLVGATSKARKGTSWGRVSEIFSRVSDWPTVVTGLSSGEGLKYHVRDPGDGDDGNAGVVDKRLLVVESEFSQVLRQTARAGNTLSATVRAAWDTGNLMTLTKNDPIKATGAHVSIVGHITADELRADLTATDSANGFANRFLFMCVKRSKLLAFGGKPLSQDLLKNLVDRIERAVTTARSRVEINMTDAAREVWRRVYPMLSEGHSGLFGAVTARAEAQVLRLALTFALADESGGIDNRHLLAAIAVWERAEASARHIFGSALGEPMADDILRALRSRGADGMTRTEIRDLFGRHGKSERIGTALALLDRMKGARREVAQPQGGRPAEIWKAV